MSTIRRSYADDGRNERSVTDASALEQAARQLTNAVAARKCWSCGCLHGSLASIEAATAARDRGSLLGAAIRAARERLLEIKYECLACDVCYPALALNVLAGPTRDIAPNACPTEQVETRDGWPALPGAYAVLRYCAAVAICTLTGDALASTLARTLSSDVAIVGTMQTENLGIERLILNVLGNPNIGFVVVCGADSHGAVGHLPGQSLVALAGSGVDDNARIIGAKGKRPVLQNLSREAIDHFRKTVGVVDLVGESREAVIDEAVRRCAARWAGPSAPFRAEAVIVPITGYIADRMRPDPAGYFVIYADHGRQVLSLEHYRNDGVLDALIEGTTAAETYTPAIDRGLVSRLDHAAYLARELERAAQAVRTGTPYVQDGAPERRERPSAS